MPPGRCSGNGVHTGSDIEKTIHLGRKIKGVQGIVIIKGDQIGLWGDLKLVRLPGTP